MPTVTRSVIVSCSCREMFALVDAVEDYPEFLPWCPSTQVFERDERVTRARIRIAYGGLESHIETRNEKDPPNAIALALVDGPFRDFRGAWTFSALGDAGCRVQLELDYSFSSRALEAVLGPVFGHVTETLVDRFVARAEAGR